MANFRAVIILFSCAVTFVTVQCNSRVNIVGKNITCASNPEFVYNLTCKMQPMEGKSVHKWFVDVNLQPNVTIKNFYMKFSQLRKANDGKFKPYLGISNVTLDICMFLKNGPHSFLLDIVSASLKKFLTPYHSCPYSGHIYAKDIVIDESRFPSMIMVGDYIYQLYGYTIENHIERYVANVRVQADVRNP